MDSYRCNIISILVESLCTWRWFQFKILKYVHEHECIDFLKLLVSPDSYCMSGVPRPGAVWGDSSAVESCCWHVWEGGGACGASIPAPHPVLHCVLLCPMLCWGGVQHGPFRRPRIRYDPVYDILRVQCGAFYTRCHITYTVLDYLTV